MAFAGHRGVSLNVDLLVTEGDGIADSRAEYGDSKNWAAQVSARREELTLRALVQRGARRDRSRCRRRAATRRCAMLREAGLSRHSHVVGKTNDAARSSRSGATRRRCSARRCASCTRPGTRSAGASAACATTPTCADAEHEAAGRDDDPGLHVHLAGPRSRPTAAAPAIVGSAAQGRDPARAGRQQPRRAELRDGPGRLRHLRRPHDRPAVGRGRASTCTTGFVACGGFSYGDTLGAGEGWARSMLLQCRSSPTSSRPSSPAPTCSRSASATAAR